MKTLDRALRQRHLSIMQGLVHRLSDQAWRLAMGRRFEAFTNETFQVIRWVLIVGFAQYMAQRSPLPIFQITYWALAGLLFAYLASRFLLRPEIRMFAEPKRRWQRMVQSAVNFVVCVVVFALVLWAVTRMTEAFGTYRATL